MRARLYRRRRAIVALLSVALAPCATAAPISSPLSPEDRALVNSAATYLEGIEDARGRFVQTDPRGAVSEGSFYLHRPGKARFAYDPPSGLTIASNGKIVAVVDTHLRTFQSYPLRLTPLSLFLARDVRLDRGVAVTKVTRLADGFSIVARDGRKQAEGRITLTFAQAPLRLTGWTVTDAQGAATRVRLAGFAPSGPLDPALFELSDPRGAGRRDSR
jgi:outer membrane lipoprotein-sorting protein